MIDEFKIWNAMRTETQIKEGMNIIIGANTPGLMLYLQMHDGEGTSIMDKSGKGLHASVTSPSWTMPYSNLIYTWTPATTPQTGATVLATPMANTTYSLIATSQESGCQGSYSLPVKVKPSPCIADRSRLVDEESSVSEGEDVMSHGVHIYPNPNDGSFIISLKEAQQVTIEIIDAKGNKVKEVKGSADQFNIDALNLSAGLYAVNIITNGKMISRKMTIIK
ncbi:MAG: T9SS type A sorting domain-containing protein [Sporocytophaga sp.]|nr:T9SS type A sorting domain-containing protein [Sporocytophaga sp.]